jgi:hypothetical protein
VRFGRCSAREPPPSSNQSEPSRTEIRVSAFRRQRSNLDLSSSVSPTSCTEFNMAKFPTLGLSFFEMFRALGCSRGCEGATTTEKKLGAVFAPGQCLRKSTHTRFFLSHENRAYVEIQHFHTRNATVDNRCALRQRMSVAEGEENVRPTW